jgi:hypothetical protein
VPYRLVSPLRYCPFNFSPPSDRELSLYRAPWTLLGCPSSYFYSNDQIDINYLSQIVYFLLFLCRSFRFLFCALALYRRQRTFLFSIHLAEETFHFRPLVETTETLPFHFRPPSLSQRAIPFSYRVLSLSQKTFFSFFVLFIY